MLPSTRRRLPPWVLTKYVLREFLGFLVPMVSGFVLLYILVDVFERLNILLKSNATLSASIRYFLFKVPLMVTQILPPAVIVSVLIALGMASRRNEVTAMRASGISLLQTGLPILMAAAAISSLALVWNETVVPACTRYYQEVNLVEIRKRDRRSLLSDREIWYHGKLGFYNIAHIDSKKREIFGLSIYQLNQDFSLRRIVQIPKLRWLDNDWEIQAATEHVAPQDGRVVVSNLPISNVEIPDRFEDFLEVQQAPEELGFFALRERIEDLRRKGIDPSNLAVDLHLKLAIPFASLVLACIAIPIGGRISRNPSLAAVIGTGVMTGFGYWIILGLGNSLGQSGILPPLVAAWSANCVYALLGVILFLRAE